MKKRKIQVVVVLFIAAVTLLSSSFGRQVDIEERVLCHAMGVDYENGEYNVSLQVFKTQSMGSDTPLDVSQSNIQTVNCKGRSIRDAIEGCQYQLGREIFFGHLQIICFTKGFVRSEKEGEDITDECLIFSGIDGRSLDPILKMLREKEATVKLKAIVTAHNQSWNVGELIKELRREHLHMNGGDSGEK